MPPGRTTRASSASVAPGIVDVAEQIGEGDVVERCVRKGHGLRGGLHELRLLSEPAARDGEHLVALVEPGHAESVGAAARRRRGPFPSRRRGRGRDPLEAARRGSAARADPGRARAPLRRGRRTGRGARRALGRGRFATTRRRILATWASPNDIERVCESGERARGVGDDVVSGVIPTEPTSGGRVFLCAFDDADGRRSWLACSR